MRLCIFSSENPAGRGSLGVQGRKILVTTAQLSMSDIHSRVASKVRDAIYRVSSLATMALKWYLWGVANRSLERGHVPREGSEYSPRRRGHSGEG